MPLSVQSICNTLAIHGLLPKEKVREAYLRWVEENSSAKDNATAFGIWLVSNEILTAYQLDFINKDKVARLKLNDYILVDRLGQGRMAGIYKAVHKGGQVVAIKILPPSKVKDEEAFARFQREARLAMRFKHPNVVRTFSQAEADGLHYIAMEFLVGETLEEILKRRKKLPPDEAARLLSQALEGLQHLYEEDVTHRDIKPANFMVVPLPKEGEPDTTYKSTLKILDVGLGKALFDDGAGPGGMELTEAGDLLGAAAYMAPEQARDARTADVRADLYSLGCVFYEVLTGQPPFYDKNTTRILVRHATESPKSLKEKNPDVPDYLNEVILTFLSKDPAQRYSTPEKALKKLKLLAKTGETHIAPQSSPPIAKRV